jgi:hypothetical protein
MTDVLKAREMWAGLAREERKKILAALHADETMADHDWAGLPPQVHTGIIAGMPVEPPHPPPLEHDDAKTEDAKTKKGKA